MLLDGNRLTQLARKLDDARASSTCELDSSGQLINTTGLYCPQKEEGGRAGVHGRNYLAIDPDTEEVRCSKCPRN